MKTNDLHNYFTIDQQFAFNDKPLQFVNDTPAFDDDGGNIEEMYSHVASLVTRKQRQRSALQRLLSFLSDGREWLERVNSEIDVIIQRQNKKWKSVPDSVDSMIEEVRIGAIVCFLC